MDNTQFWLLWVVVGLILALAFFAAFTSVRDVKKAGQDWKALLFFWGFVFIFAILIFFIGYNEIKPFNL